MGHVGASPVELGRVDCGKLDRRNVDAASSVNELSAQRASKAADGVLCCKVAGGSNKSTFLIWQGTAGDFELQLKFRIKAGNSGKWLGWSAVGAAAAGALAAGLYFALAEPGANGDGDEGGGDRKNEPDPDYAPLPVFPAGEPRSP